MSIIINCVIVISLNNIFMSKIKSAINIKIISVGNRGCNVLERLNNLSEQGVKLCAISAAGKVFNRLKIKDKIELSHSFDLEQNQDIEKTVKQIIIEKQKEIAKLIDKTDVVFLVSDLADKISIIQIKEIARLFKKEGVLVFFIGITPFPFEGKAKQKTAQKMKAVLEKEVDAFLAVDNEKIVKQKISAIDAFTQADKTIVDLVIAILDIVVKNGVINIDFSDLKTIVKNSGEVFFNSAVGSKNEITAITNNLFSQTNLTNRPDCLEKILYVIYAGKDLLMDEVSQIGEKIHKKLNKQEKIIFGIVNDDKMKGKLKIVIIGG